MEQTWLETCFSAHPYNKGYIYTHIPPTRSSRTNRLAKGTRICFQTWKDFGLLDLTNLGILPREPKSYWVFSSRRDSMRQWEDHKPPFPPGCDSQRSTACAEADPRVRLFVRPQPRCLGETLGSRRLAPAVAGPSQLPSPRCLHLGAAYADGISLSPFPEG